MQIQFTFPMVFNALTKRLALYQARRRSRRALLALSDDLLKDIGLSRAQAVAEGGKPFWQASKPERNHRDQVNRQGSGHEFSQKLKA
ncbi:DUF1127 domain-containing protein [Agarivorans aestuarii]|uniref:DUF1127 domain-containing protein n=1 Tax=Agarivorans aestuarii TaxID=1563703 RepID=A0ABU7G3X9_9ALTE|nr:DUF1127 domain-containing protein [Agarivorans aestuarii]MEE1673916.1 DUF1127 domain-containing protein [Agarivorans aestuarii]